MIRRARVHGPLLTGFVGTALLLCAVALAVVGRLDAAVDDGARAIAARHAGADLVTRVSLDLAEDPERQDDQVRTALGRSLAGLATPWTVDRTVSADVPLTVPTHRDPGEKRVVTATSVDDLAGRATLVAGTWPEGRDDVAVQADAADELGVRPGDAVVLGGVPLHVAGTWRATDHLDPRWVGDPQVATGTADGRFGPLVIDGSRWPELATDEVRVHWVVVPDLARTTADDLAAMSQATRRLGDDLPHEVDDAGSLAVDGRLAAVAREVAVRTDGLRAVQPVVLLLLAAVGLVALAALARLFASTHAEEIALLWARGASSGALAGAAALETAVAAAVGGAVGALVALPAAAPSAVAVVVTLTAVTVAAAALVAWQVELATRRHLLAWRGPVGRAGRLVGPGLVVLAVAAAALTVWQLRTYGSPVTVDSDGVPRVDPIAVTAPATLLVAVVLLGLLVFPVVAARAERRSSSEDVTRVLAARHLARRIVPVTAPLLVVAIAAATVATAAAYGRTWSDGFDETRQLRAGADVRVSTDEPGVDITTLTALSEVPGVRAVAPAAIELGGDVGALVAVTPAALDALGRGLSGAERERTVAALTSGTTAPELPSGSGEIGVTVEAFGLGRPPRVTLVVADAAGALREVPARLRDGSVPGTLAYAADLPPDTSGVPGAQAVAAIELGVAADEPTGSEQPRIGLVALAADGTDLETGPWTAHLPGNRELELAPGDAAPDGDVVVEPGVRAIRLTPSYAAGSPDGPRAPAVISQAAAERLDLEVGDPLTLSLAGTYGDLETTVERIVPAVPGAPEESAALVDLRAVEQARLNGQNVVPSPTDAWIGADSPEQAAVAVRSALPANSQVETATDAAARAALHATVDAWWLGALGCGLLALLTVVTVARGQLRARRGDVAVLRALGLSVRQQQTLRGRELAWTVAFALVVGLVAGAAVAFLVVTPLARAAVPEPYPTIGTDLGVDPAGLVAGAVLLAAALAGTIGWYVWRVGVEVRRTRGSGGER